MRITGSLRTGSLWAEIRQYITNPFFPEPFKDTGILLRRQDSQSTGSRGIAVVQWQSVSMEGVHMARLPWVAQADSGVRFGIQAFAPRGHADPVPTLVEAARTSSASGSTASSWATTLPGILIPGPVLRRLPEKRHGSRSVRWSTASTTAIRPIWRASRPISTISATGG
jgi:hypothetical protein